MKRLLFIALIPALAFAQEKRTEAEELFEKAWWEESASGALDKALEGYKKAADAAGPAAIRARAVYRAAIVEQRLGRTDAAVALLERLAKDFPGETDLLKESKARLQEWTAVDLRKSFSEWYRSYVFSPEFQARVVDLVLRLGTAKPEEQQEVRGQLLTIGDASVPALEEALKSSNQQLCYAATELLLDLGVVPPTDALIRYPSWVRNGEKRWLVIFQADEATRKRVRKEAKGDEPLARALRAVATSPEEMFSFAVSESAYPAQYVLGLLYRNGSDAMRERLEGLILEPSVPVHVVSYLRNAFPQGPADADVARCVKWARSLPTKPAREAAAVWAARRLTEKSEGDLDAVLALVPGAEQPYSEVAAAVLASLRSQGRGTAQFAWTPVRVGGLLDLSLRLEAAGTPVVNYNTSDPATEVLRELTGLISNLRTNETGAIALAAALLDRAARVRSSWLQNLVSSGVQVTTDSGQKPWQEVLCERVVERWPAATVQEKIDLLEIASRSSFGAELRKRLGDELTKDAVARDTEPALQVAIVNVLLRIPARDLLAPFDLNAAEDARAAIEVLNRLSRHVTRDGETTASINQILIHGDSAARRKALEFIWDAQNAPALLPAAKEVVADEDAAVRLWAVNRLAEWNDFGAAPYLVKALGDSDAEIRAAAAGGLARVGREDAVPALIKLLDDPSPGVREAALKALEQIQKVAEVKKAWKLEQAGFR